MVDRVFDRETVTAPSPPQLVPVDVDVHEPTTRPTEPSGHRSPSAWLLSDVTESEAMISRNGQRQTLSAGGLF